MRLIFLTHYFPPEVNAPANRAFETCREWVRLGHEVHVVTGFPSHPRGILYPGWRRHWHARETCDGVFVHRVWTVLGANQGVAKRLLNYLSFVPFAVWRAVRLGRADGIIATSPQFFCAVAGWIAASAKRTRWAFELRDLWPESVLAVGAVRRSIAVRAIEAMELAMYRHAAAVVCLTLAFVENLATRGIPRNKLHFVPNGVDLDFWERPIDAAACRARYGLSDRHVIASYVGTVGMAHGIGTILEAATLLTSTHPEVRFVIVGDGAELDDLRQRARRATLESVMFIGQIPHDEVRNVLAMTDVSLVLLRNQAVFRTVLPSKMFESMAAAKPIVLAVQGEAQRLLEASGGGVAIAPEDAPALARAVAELAASPARRNEMGKAGRTFVEREYDRRVWARRYASILERVFVSGGP